MVENIRDIYYYQEIFCCKEAKEFLDCSFFIWKFVHMEGEECEICWKAYWLACSYFSFWWSMLWKYFHNENVKNIPLLFDELKQILELRERHFLN